MKNILLTIITLVFLAGCSGGGDSDATTVSDSTDESATDTTEVVSKTLASKYYGKWSYVHSGESIDIISTTELNATEIQNDDNLLEVHADNTTYFLVRSSLANTTIRGKIEAISDTATSLSSSRKGSSFSSIGGIDIILKNVLDESIKEETTTNDDGSFTTTTLPSGRYNLTASDDNNQLDAIVDIQNQENDIGVYKLTGDNLNNFKAELIISEEYILSNSNVYEAILRIHNISEKIGYGLSYDIALNRSDNIKSFTEGSIDALGSVQAKSYKDIPISFSFNRLSTNMDTYGVDVNIKDALGNQWIDTFNFNVHKDEIAILISTKSADIKGYIKNPLTGEMKQINTSDGKIMVPLMPEDKPYQLVLSNPSFEDETAYSIGINALPQTFESFKDTAAHEPNNDTSDASIVSINTSEISYLHATDIDYWSIITSENTVVDESVKDFTNATTPQVPTTVPVNLTATDGDFTDKVVLTWSAVADSTYYELYRSDAEAGIYTKISNNLTLTTLTDVNVLEDTIYYYKTKACNEVGCSDFSSVNSGYILVPNILPIADAGLDINASLGDSITLDASASSDADGSIVSYQWLQNSTLLSTSKSFTTTNLNGGLNEIALVVTDDDGATATDIIKVYLNRAPQLTSPTTITVNENQTSALTITATDADNDTLTYSLTGTDVSYFNIDANTGVVTFKVAPDYETKTSYSITANASDGTITVTDAMTLNITNIREVPSISGFSASIDENSLENTVVGNITILDSGDSAISQINLSGIGSADFNVATDGTLVVANGATIDYEMQSVYNITAVATNVVGNSEIATIDIFVNNVNETPTISSLSVFSLYEKEVKIETVIANDPDGDALTYSIIGGTDSNKFDLNSSTGELIFNIITDYDNPLDADLDNNYSVDISVSDGSFQVNQSITVSVTAIMLNNLRYRTVTSPTTGRIWLDRNLGASQVCATYDDTLCYGDYFQWGRKMNGHEKSDSAISYVNIIEDLVSNGVFISSDWETNYDWRALQDDDLWNGSEAINNPCPSRYRLPTEIELKLETTDNSIYNRSLVFDSFLKIPANGNRLSSGGYMRNIGYGVSIWTSSTATYGARKSRYLFFDGTSSNWGDSTRGDGYSVRCIKE